MFIFLSHNNNFYSKCDQPVFKKKGHLFYLPILHIPQWNTKNPVALISLLKCSHIKNKQTTTTIKNFFIPGTSIFKLFSPADIDKLRDQINDVCPFQTQNLTYIYVCAYLSIHFNLGEFNPRLFTRASCFNGLITYPNPHLNKLGEAAKGFGWISYKAPWQMVTIILLSVSEIWRPGWILQFWMIKEQQQVSAFHPSSSRRLWLPGHADITTTIHIPSPPGTNPGTCPKLSEIPVVY